MRSSVRLRPGPAKVAAVLAAAVLALASFASVAPVGAASTFLGGLHSFRTVASTVPANGDVNPYGVAVVPVSMGSLVKGDVLVSNFNDKANLQGTGTTIDEIAPGGGRHLFAKVTDSMVMGRCPGGVGLTTALVALRSGFVVVGSLPTSDGMSATAKAGCLIVLDSSGKIVTTIHGGAIDGPWDAVAWDGGSKAAIFVANVLNGTVAANGGTVDRGTVVRLDVSTMGGMFKVTSERVIGRGFAEKTDPNALVIGPTGLALAHNGTLYVADTVNSRIAAIPNALMRTSALSGGMTVAKGGGLNQPLGLALAPNGDLIAVNAGDGNGVEIAPSGHQVATRLLDKGGAGSLFGLAIVPSKGLYFVEDDTNNLALLH